MARKTPPRIEPKVRSDNTPSTSSKGVRTPVRDTAKKKSKPPREPREGSSLKWRLVKFLFKIGIVAAIWGAILIGVGVIYYTRDLPPIGNLQEMKKTRKVTLLGADGTTLANFGDLYADYASYDEIPPYLVDAVMATEDRRFFDHFGIDFIGMARAAYTNYRAGHVVQGGSTVTQQLAKIIFLSPKRTMKRKIQEAMFALYLEHKLTKKQIMTIYLNRVYMGSGIYGAPAAAKYYFHKNIKDLNLYECAMIAGLLKAPSRYSPTSSTERAGHRTYQILVNMKAAGYITDLDLKNAQHNPLMLETSDLGSAKNAWFADWVMEQLPYFTGDTTSDLIIHTTFNPTYQQAAEKAVNDVLSSRGAKMRASEAASVVMAPDGAVLAMVGGTSYAKSPFNRAVKAQRQPGSSFKLFVYLTAFEHGYTPDQELPDEPITIGKWTPKDYEGHFSGMMPLREAFAHSVNTIAVRLSETVGRTNVIAMAHRLGITSNILPNPSIALGSTDVNLLEMTSAYATIANHGYAVWPHGIEEITTTDGSSLYKRNSNEPDQLIPEPVVEEMTDLLMAVVDHGTGKGAAIDRPVAGKTGTTNDYRDAWFIGFSADTVAGVWVGNDNDQSMRKVTGGSLPAAIWKETMTAVEQGKPVKELAHYSSPVQPAPMNAVPQESETPDVTPDSNNPDNNNMDNPDNPSPDSAPSEKDSDSFWNHVMQTIGGDGK